MWLKHQAFFYSLFLSRLADQILLFLVPLVVFQLTGSVAWSGLAFFFETLPRFLSFPICGALCDRISPLRLLRVSQLYRAGVCLGGMGAYAVFGGIGWLIAISALCGVLTTQDLMAREVMLPQAFAGFRFEKVASHTQIADQLGMVLGPMMAAVLLKVWSWEYVVVATALLFLAADGAVIAWQRFVRPIVTEPEAQSGNWTLPMATALRHIVALPGLIEVIILAAAINLVLGTTLATSAAMVTGIHGQSESWYAILQTAGAIATVTLLLATANTSMPLKTMGIVAFVAIFAGGLLAGLGSGPYLYALGFVLVVGFDKVFSVFIRSLRQRIIPPQDLGKTTGLIAMLNNLSQPLAGLLVTLFAGTYGAGGILTASSCVMAMVGLIVAALWLRRAQREATAAKILFALNKPIDS